MKPRTFLACLLLFQVVASTAILLDIPFARQIFAFLYLMFVPGLLIVKLLKLDELDNLEILLFSVGLSIAFLFLVALFMSEFWFLSNISSPFALIPMLTALNIITGVGGVLVYISKKEFRLSTFKVNRLLPVILLSMCVPVLSIGGALWANISGSTKLLLAAIGAVAVLFGICVLMGKRVSERIYVAVTVAISLALLFHSSLISNFIQGHDIHLEYYVARITQINGIWSSSSSVAYLDIGRVGSMLSVTILPTLFSNMMNLDMTWVLKIAFPLLFAFVPLALYKMWQNQTNSKIAFVSAFLFMGELTFHSEMLALARQMVAELFLALILLLIMKKRTLSTGWKVCFLTLCFAVIVSHYSIALILLFFLAVFWLYSFVFKKESGTIKLPLIVLYFAMMFSWYIYTSGSASFETMVDFGEYVYLGLGEFSSMSSRGEGVMRGTGLAAVQSNLQWVSRGFAYAVEVFIVIGLVLSIVRRRKTASNLNYLVFSSMSMVLLAMCILLPNLAQTLRMERFFHITLFCLAPFLVIGCMESTRYIAKNKTELYAWILALIVLVPYFLFQTGFVYEVAGTASWSVPLSKYRMNPVYLTSGGHVNAFDVAGAEWLSVTRQSDALIYADSPSRSFVLTSYGGIYRGQRRVLSNTTTIEPGGIVYLSRLNTVYGVGVEEYAYDWNTSQIWPGLSAGSMIYSNGGCEVFMTAEKIILHK